jgi:CubicO group peptidase (beta-lactamase class C family)
MPFHVAGIDKLVVAAVVMKLYEWGRLGLKDRIPAHLPSSLVRRLHRREGVDHSDSPTVRYLPGHASGLQGRKAGKLSIRSSVTEQKPTLAPKLGRRRSGESRNPGPGADLWTPAYAGVTNGFHPPGSA